MFRHPFFGSWHDCGQLEVSHDSICFKFELKKPNEEEIQKIINIGRHFYAQCAYKVTPQIRDYLYDPDSSDEDSDSDDEEVITNPSACTYRNGYSIKYKFDKEITLENLTQLLNVLEKMNSIHYFMSAISLEKIKAAALKFYDSSALETKKTLDAPTFNIGKQFT